MSKYRTRTLWDRLLSGVLCLALALGLLPTVGLVQTAEAAHWADPYAEQLIEWGVMTESRLDAAATRAEFVAMCNRAFGYSKLGGTPFKDVAPSAWYAQDIDIAYNAGYFMGTSATTASPEDPLTREQAAVLLSRVLRLQETVGESLGFTDSRELSEWSRGLIAASAAEGLIGGYDDGSYRPFNNVTRGELAVMLVRAIGNPISTSGNHKLGDVYGNVTISSSNVTLRDTVILGNLYITGGVDLGNVLLENVTVLGRIIVSGGGVSDAAQSSVILRNVKANELVVDSMVNQFVTISTYGLTDIPLTSVRSDAYLEDACSSGYGLSRIELVGTSGTELQLAGTIKEVVNMTPNSLLRLVKGTAETITIDEYATNSELVIDVNTRADVVNLDVATLVTGKGDIFQLNIGANGSVVEILPEHMDVRPGLTATLVDDAGNETEVGSAAASELSSEPRLMAGYPSVSDLRPTQAQGMFSGNKPGTIYWAVSELASGSVNVEDLINNPSYGGNILKTKVVGADGKETEVPQAGSVNAEARAIYAQLISGLTADGSYYISAVLVDDRGNRSPVKVISFSTPDDTVPAFTSDPYMSRISCDIAQVTAMANKNCTLYWVLLPAAASAPTPQSFKSGSYGANYGYGTQSVVKNAPISLKVNTSRLPENTEFNLYLWLEDFDGTLSSEVVHVLNADTKKDSDPTFRTPDETAPVVTNIRQTNYDLTDAIEFSFTINEAGATLYWAVVTETNGTFIKSSDDLNGMSAQVKVESGTKAGAIVGGHKVADGAGMPTEVKAGTGESNFNRLLDYNKYGTHNFKMYYVAKDAAGNYSEVKFIIIHTQDNDPPSVTLSFSNAMYNEPADKAAGRTPRPQTDSDLILTFSEQIKGDSAEDADSFVDLYNDVARYKELLANEPNNTSYSSMLSYYKDILAEELAKHISLIYVKDRQTYELMPKGTRTDGQDDSVIGWLDLREAIVALEKDGTVTLTLPGDTAVRLGSGMTYYFHFKNIYDDSYTANLLVLRDDKGNIIAGDGKFENELDMATFTTVYAQVWLDADDSGISDTSDTDGLVGKDQKPIPLDMVVNVTPQSTANTTATDCWDMVFWSDIAVKFDVYRRVSTGTNDWTDWELAAKDVSIDGLGQNNNATLTAASLSRYKTTQMTNDDGTVTGGYIGGKDFEDDTGGGKEYTRAQYDTVVGGLQEGPVYQYGISFTRVNDSNEREAWTSLVQMRFSLVAGMQGNVRDLSVSNSVNSSYTDLVNTRELLDEIGSVLQGNTTGAILQIERQFSDTRLPEFTNTSPTFDARTGTIDISFALNRAGTVYYVLAPADGTVPTTFDGKEINYAMDGRDYDTETDLSKKKDAIKTGITEKKIDKYIPLSGAERDAFGPADENDTNAIVDFSKVTAPTVSQIFRGAFKGELVRTGSIQYEGTREPIRIAENLAPGTWYYVYLILQSSSGNLGTEVHIYRVQTKDVDPPVIIVGHYEETVKNSNGTETTHVGVNMTINDRNNEEYDSPVLNYALAQKSKLPSWFNERYIWADKRSEGGDGPEKSEAKKSSGTTMTLLEAMLSRPGQSGESYFDLYAGETLKKQVMQYITQATSADQWGTSMRYYPQVSPQQLAETRPWLQDCTNDLTMEGEYVMLVCARNYYKASTEGSNYGFAAVQGLYKPDDVPPELTFPAVGSDGTLKMTAAFTQAYDPTGETGNKGIHYSIDEYGPGPQSWLYYGTIQITFDKAIYVYKDQVLLQVVAAEKGEATAGQISILDVIGSDFITGATDNASHTSFTLTYYRMRSGQGFTISNLFNSSGSEKGKSTKTLSVMFDTSELEGNVWVADDGKITDMRRVQPKFNVTWK